jgi:hypothetical protein
MAGKSPVALGRAVWEGSGHLCAFFHSRIEEHQVLLRFLKEGLELGDKGILIDDDRERGEQAHRLNSAGVDVCGCEQRGQLTMHGWGETYLRTGGFNQHDMLSLVDEVLGGCKRQGFERTRLWANMGWALHDFAGTEDLAEYESRTNDILRKYHNCVVCAYDLTKFSASVAMDVMRAHPFVLLGGMLHANPFYLPPDEFLRELNARKELSGGA